MKPMPFICPGSEGVDVPRYVLQRVNIHVFKNPAQVMENIYIHRISPGSDSKRRRGSGSGNPVLH